MRTHISFLLFVAIVFFAGCDSGPSRPGDLPKLHLVKITFTQDGTPLQGANVTLLSTTTQTYGSASGTTDASGVVVPGTYGFDGVPEGEYIVSVSKTVIEGGTERMDGNVRLTVGGNVYQFVHADYLDAGQSPLRITVSGPMSQTFDVGAPVRVFVMSNNE